jgi:tripartite-type tricarboxylate transporter receptor subunit TctC
MKPSKFIAIGFPAVFLSGLIFLMSSTANADADWPKKPITMVVGFSAGGGTDTYARILASVIPPFINNQALVIVNKTGGAQIPAMKFTSEAKPDGYTMQLFATGAGVLATMIKNSDVDWFRDFRPVAQIGNLNLIVASHVSKGYKTPQGLAKAINEAYAKGKKLRWGHAGRGTAANLSVVAWLLKNDLLDKVEDVPFKGGAPTLKALADEQLDFAALAVNYLVGFEDKIEGLGLFANERDPVQKNVPTMKEQGMPFVEFYSPMTVGVPAKTPQAIIDKMNVAIKKATETQAFKRLSKKLGLAVAYRGPEETLALMQSLREQWKPAVEIIKKQQAQK